MFFFMSRGTPADFSFNHSSKTGPGRQNRSQMFVERALHQACDLKDWLHFTVLLGKYLPLLPIVTFLQMCKPKTEQTSVVPCNNYFNYLFFMFTWVLTDLASFCWDLCRCNLCTCSLLGNLTQNLVIVYYSIRDWLAKEKVWLFERDSQCDQINALKITQVSRRHTVSFYSLLRFDLFFILLPRAWNRVLCYWV